MALPVTGVLNLANRQKIVESKTIELAKPPHTTATLDTNTPSPTQLQHMSSFITAPRGLTRPMVERVGLVSEEWIERLESQPPTGTLKNDSRLKAYSPPPGDSGGQ